MCIYLKVALFLIRHFRVQQQATHNKSMVTGSVMLVIV